MEKPELKIEDIDPLYIYDNGFGKKVYHCNNCKSHRLLMTPSGTFSPPNYLCVDCGEDVYAPSWTNFKTKKNIKFGVFCNQTIGHLRKAVSPEALIEALPKRVKTYWSSIMYKDEEGRTITITKEYLEDQGMTLKEVIEDWIEHGDTEEDIMVLNPKGSGTIYL